MPSGLEVKNPSSSRQRTARLRMGHPIFLKSPDKEKANRLRLGKRQTGQRLRMLGPYRAQLTRIQAQRLQDGRGNLARLDLIVKRGMPEAGVGDDQHHVAVVVGKAAMLGNFARPAGVDDANVGSHDDVGSAGVDQRIVELQAESRTGENLAL